MVVGMTKQGANPEMAREQIHDAMKACKKDTKTRHLDPLMKKGCAEKITNLAVADTLGYHTAKKKSGGRWTMEHLR